MCAMSDSSSAPLPRDPASAIGLYTPFSWLTKRVEATRAYSGIETKNECR